MPVDRTLAERVAQSVVELYGDLELRLLEGLARQIRIGGNPLPDADAQIAALARLRQWGENAIRKLDGELGPRIEQALALAYAQGSRAALDELAKLAGAGPGAVDEVTGALPGADAIQRLAWSLGSLLRGTHLRVLRWELDAYRDVVAKASASVLAGQATRLRASQVALERLVAGGVKGFVDKAGRRWALTSYVEMATRTTVAQAAVEGHLDRLRSAGIGLVIVSNAPQECSLCRRWEGKVLRTGSGPLGPVRVPHAITGRPVPIWIEGTVADALLGGLMHPNCRHSLSAFLPGVTEIPTHTADPEGDKLRQEQRALERKVREWKRKEAAALSPAFAQAAAAKVRGYQRDIREHIRGTDLRRLRYREQINIGMGTEGRRERFPDPVPDPVPPPSRDEDVVPDPAPVAEPAVDLTALTDDELYDRFGALSADPDSAGEALAAVMAEMEARDAAAEEPLVDEPVEPGPTPAEILAALDLSTLSDDEVFEQWRIHADDPDVVALLAAELERRDEASAALPAAEEIPLPTPLPADVWPAPAVEDWSHLDDELTPEQARVEELVAAGVDYASAYADVYGVDEEEMLRQERAALVDEHRRPGQTREQALRGMYEEYVYLQWLGAEEATRGHLLSPAGEAAGIEVLSLFSGPAARARKYASEDLLRWWADHGRMTFTEYRAMVLGRDSDRAAAAEIRAGRNGRDFI